MIYIYMISSKLYYIMYYNIYSKHQKGCRTCLQDVDEMAPRDDLVPPRTECVPERAKPAMRKSNCTSSQPLADVTW